MPADKWLNKIHQGDALEVLKQMPDEFVHCCVTSPPYWGLRDYGVPGQIGLEKTIDEYVSKIVEVFNEVRRVLRKDASVWLNLGDSYAGSTPGARDPHRWPKQSRNDHRCKKPTDNNLKPKDLCLIPARIALALQVDGWWIRSQIPWVKNNCMPESTKDRPTNAVEYIFLLSKSKKYHYDHEAVKLPASFDTHARYARGRSADHKYADGGPGNQTIARSLEHMVKPDVNPKARKAPAGWQTGSGSHDQIPKGRYPKPKQNPSFSEACRDIVGTRARRNSDWFYDSLQGFLYDEEGQPLAFIVNSQGFSEAHFATFPEKLVEPCILAGCPRDGIVLDPFMGSGTVAKVALRLGRQYIGIELNPEYIKMAERRLRGTNYPLMEVT